MSHMSLRARRLAGAGVLAVAALGAAGPAANAADATFNYSCNYPLIGTQPLKVAVNASIPQKVNVGDRTTPFAITATATPGGDTLAGLRTVLAASLEGSVSASATLNVPGADGLDLDVPINIASQSVPSSGGLSLAATGQTPALSFPRAGLASVALGDLTLNLTAKTASGEPIQLPPVGTDSDGDPNTFDVSCTLDPAAQSKLLSTITVASSSDPSDSSAPSTPGGVSGSAESSSTARLSWNASTDNVGVVAYEVLQGGKVIQTVTGTSTTIGGLDAGATTGFTVRARDAAGNVSGASGTANVTTPADTSTGTIVDYGYSIIGTSNLRTLTQGPVPIAGSIAAKINLRTGNYSADLKLNSTKAALKLIGFIPVTAQIGFNPAAQTTGTLKDGLLTVSAPEIIRLPQLYLFGAIPVAGAGGCRTQSPSVIGMRSTGGPFNPLKGGTLAGTYALSALTDCGALTGIISPFAQGSGNTVSVKLVPKT